MNKVRINAGIKLLAKSDILKHVPVKVHDEIKAQDSNPMFVMMTVGHEGECAGQLFDGDPQLGKKLSQWYRQLWPVKAVKQLVAKMKKEEYPAIWEDHADTEDGVEPGSRLVVGNIIASTKRTIDGIMHAVGIGYINNLGTKKKLESGEFNACSIEATCVFEEAENIFRYVVQEVVDFFGVALCNSEVNTPGFDKANIIAVVTAMAKEKDGDDDDGKGKDKPMTVEECKKFIVDHGVAPDKLFTIEQLTAVPKVKDVIDNEVKTAVVSKDEEVKKLKEEIEPLKKKTVRERLESMIVDSKLLENQDKQVVEYLKSVIEIEGEPSQEDIDKKVKAQLKLMKTAGFEIKEEKKEEEDDPSKKKDEKKEEDEKKLSEDEKLVSPEHNPLIPKTT